MKLYEMIVRDYGEKLKSSDPAPGGGTAAAFSGLQGAALLTMVAELTLGREKYAQYETLCKSVSEKSACICQRFLELTEEDAQAYFAVADAFKLPRATEEEKQVRSAAIREATLRATQVPFETMELGLAALREAEKLIGNSNPNAASDLGVAALTLNTCVYGAWLNVRINLSGLKDAQKEAEFSAAGSKMCKEASRLCEKIYTAVCAAME